MANIIDLNRNSGIRRKLVWTNSNSSSSSGFTAHTFSDFSLAGYDAVEIESAYDYNSTSIAFDEIIPIDSAAHVVMASSTSADLGVVTGRVYSKSGNTLSCTIAKYNGNTSASWCIPLRIWLIKY